MSVRFLVTLAALGLVSSLAACNADSTLAPSLKNGADNLPGDTRGVGGKRNDDGVTINPAKGQGGGEAQPADDKGHAKGKQNDDVLPHP